MKKTSIPIMFVCIVLIVNSCANVETQEAKETNISPLAGAWEYIDQEGLAIATESHFSWIIKTQTIIKDTLTEVETTVESINAAGGTYSFTDSLYTWTYLYSTDPEDVGTSFQTVSTFEGDTTKYTFINPDGSLGNTGVARRITSQ
jgi:hypothetical protein